MQVSCLSHLRTLSFCLSVCCLLSQQKLRKFPTKGFEYEWGSFEALYSSLVKQRGRQLERIDKKDSPPQPPPRKVVYNLFIFALV